MPLPQGYVLPSSAPPFARTTASKYPRRSRVHELGEVAARTHPHSTAVELHNPSLTYACQPVGQHSTQERAIYVSVLP